MLSPLFQMISVDLSAAESYSMKPRRLRVALRLGRPALLVGLLCAVVSSVAQAQLWSSLLSSGRATDWSTAGVEGGIPTRTTRCGSVIAAYSGAATAINNAIASCGTGQYVELGGGTFTLSTAIVFGKSNVTLRGQGADATKLVINGSVARCHLSQDAAVSFCAASANIGADSPDNTATWSAGYTQGTSVVTLSNTTGMVAGSTILYLDQLNDSSDGFPATGDLDVCANTSSCAAQGGGGNYARPNRALTTVHRVTAIGGSAVTIDPPIYVPNFRSGQSPGAWWGNTGNIIRNSGIEDLSVDFTGVGSGPGLQMVNADNSWVRGTRWIYNAAAGTDVFHNMIVNAFHVTIQSNYYYGPNSPPATQNYQISPHVSGSLVVENNILQHIISGFVPNGPTSRTVFAYNFCTDSYYTGPCIIEHGFTMMNLYEGNNAMGAREDIIHGTHFMNTYFRNHFDGHQNNPSGNIDAIFTLETKSRFKNIIGNVLGDTSYITTYETNQSESHTAIYELGWKGNASGVDPGNDSHVKRTLFRWGNWDTVTNATRWCGNSSNTGWTTTCASTTEVPSTITSFPNLIPPTETLPASLFRAVKPAYFGSVAWPPIGPDVTGGSVSGFGGHANKLPARLCFEGAANDSAYPSSSPRIKVFNAAACYGAGAPAPTTPTWPAGPIAP